MLFLILFNVVLKLLVILGDLAKGECSDGNFCTEI